MLPAESPAVPFVTASVVACSITWIEPPALARELPAVALTTAKTRTAAAAAAAGTSRRFISPLPCREGQDISRRDGAVYPQGLQESRPATACSRTSPATARRGSPSAPSTSKAQDRPVEIEATHRTGAWRGGDGPTRP